MIIAIIICVTVLIALKIVLYPVCVGIVLKLQHNDKVKMLCFPLYGVFRYMMKGLAEHNDVIHFKRNPAYTSKAELIITNILNKPMYIFIDAALARQVYQETKYYTKRQDELFNDITNKKSLAFQEGESWKQQRNYLTQHFNYAVLMERVPLMKKIIQETLKFDLNKRTSLMHPCCHMAAQFMKASFFNDYNDDFINGKPFAQEIESIGIELNQITYTDIWYQIRGALGFTQTSKMYSFLQTKQEKILLKRYNVVREYIFKLINDQLNNLKPESHSIITSMYAEYKDKVTHEELRELILQQYTLFVFAGTDTVSKMVAMSIYQLAKNPQIQEQLRNLVKDLEYELLSGVQVNKIELLEAFLNESLRLSVPTDAILPRVAIQDHYVGPYLVRKGSFVDIGIQPILTHPKYFEDPLEFKIERWTQGINHQAFIPFSGGPRNCIGQYVARMENKLALIYVLQNYRVILDTETKLVMTYGFNYEPQDDRLVIFQPLEQQNS